MEMLYTLHADYRLRGYPQVRDAKLPSGKTVENKKYLGKFFNEPLPADVIVPELIFLQKGAKVTHLLRGIWPGLATCSIISEHLKNILAPVSADFTFLPVTLTTAVGDSFPYYLSYTSHLTYEAGGKGFSESDICLDEKNGIDFFAVKNYFKYPIGYIITERIKNQIEALPLHGTLINELNKPLF